MLLGKNIFWGLRLFIVFPFLVLTACSWVDNGVDGNIPPRVFDDGPYSVLEGGKVAVPAEVGPLSNDEDGGNQGITAILVEAPQFAVEGGFELLADGSFTYVHDGSENYEDYFVYIANDGISDSERKDVFIKIIPVNDPPEITGQQKVDLPEDNALVLGADLLKISDPDNTFPNDFSVAVGGGENYAYNGNSITPRENYYGPLQIPVVVSDGSESSNGFDLVVTVTPVNDAPVITGWNQALLTIDEDTGLTVTLNALDVDDVEGDAITLQVQPGNGYVLDGNTVTAAPNYFGELTVDVSVSDGSDASPEKITIIVNPVNDPPWAQNDVGTTDEDIPVSVNVTKNDADPEGSAEIDKKSIIISKQAAHGSVNVAGDGVVRYRPAADFNGSDSFGYMVADIYGAVSLEGTVTITVNPVNDPPVASNDSVTAKEDESKNINVTGNDSDPDGSGDLDKSSVEIKTGPKHGMATRRSNGTVDYSPDANFYGKDKFTYQIKDHSGVFSNVATVNIVVKSVNDLPRANKDSAGTDEDKPVTIRVTDNDTDEDGNIDRSSVSVINQPAHGRAKARSRGGVTYTPAANYHGMDSFTYQVKDDKGGLSNTARVTVTVRSINDVPKITGQKALGMQEDGSLPITLGDLEVTDPDNRYPADFSLSVQDGKNYTLSGNTIAPKRNFAGTLRVPVKVRDGAADSDTFTLNITVTGINDAPTISGKPATSVKEDKRYSFVPTAADIDAGDTLKFSISNAPEWAKFDTGTGALTGTPRNKDVGITRGIVISVRDRANAEVSLPPFDITVVNVNDVPEITGQKALGMQEDGSLPITLGDLEVTDPDNRYPADFSLSVQDGKNYTLSGNTIAPKRNFAGTLRVPVKVRDGAADSDTFTLKVTVVGVNDAPTISGTPATRVNEDRSYSFVPAAADIDAGDTLKFSISNRPGWAEFDTGNGALTGQPRNGDVGVTQNIVISVRDRAGAKASLSPFNITVVNVNNVPEITGQKVLSVQEDGSLPITLGDLEVTDPDNRYPADFSLSVQDGKNYTLSGNTITPAANYTGALTVPVKVNDGTDDSNTFNLSVTVTAANDAPEITGQSPNPLATAEDTALPITLNHLTVTDPDNSYPTGFTLSVQDGTNYSRSDNTITPAANYTGALTVPVKVNDGTDDSNTFNLSVTVTAANDPPVANSDSGTTTAETLVNINVVSNDADPDGSGDIDKGSIVITSNPDKGEATPKSDGTVDYKPNDSFIGTDSFKYTIKDAAGETSNEATVTVTVSGNATAATVNHPPQPRGLCSSTPMNTLIKGKLSATDPDGDDAELQFYVKKQGSKGSVWLSTDGQFTYEPHSGGRGVDTFSYQVIDQQGAKTSATAKIIIGNTRIMPLGDAITAGIPVGSGNGYRVVLRNALLKDGYAVEFAGSQHVVPDRHEGHSGAEITTDYIAARVADWLADNPADVVLLHIGSQDFAAGGDAAVSKAGLDNILAAIERTNPEATVLLAMITDQNPINPEITLFNDRIADSAKTGKVIIIDQHGALSYPDDLADALHPSAAGYAKMAATWRSALSGVLARCP